LKKNILSLLILLSTIFAQNEIWDSGELSFNFGYPTPNELASYSGSLIPDTLSGQGCFAFKLFNNDTATFVNLAYETQQLNDTVAVMDIFIIVKRQAGDFQSGVYPINLNLQAPTLFLWIQDLEANNFIGLLETLINGGDLSQIDATIFSAISGEIAINELSSSVTSGTFEGTMISSNFSFLVIQNGTFYAERNIPSPQYTNGTLSFTGFAPMAIQGPFVPIINDEGVGGQSQLTADTAGVGIIGFKSSSLDSIDLVLSSIITTETDNFATGATFPISNTSPTGAQFAYVRGLDMNQFLSSFSNGASLDSMEFENAYVGVSGFLTLDYISDQQVQLSADSILLQKPSDGSITTIYNYFAVALAPESNDIRVTPYIPETIDLGAAYPNPFNGTTILPLITQSSTTIELKVFDVLGREIFAQSHAVAIGRNDLKLNFTSKNFPSGWYMIQAHKSGKVVGTSAVLFVK
jgi:hypothetical protein